MRTRRHDSWLIGLALGLLLLGPALAAAKPSITFPLGVASGDVTPTSAVLWTRVDRETDVQVEVSTQQTLAKPVFKMTVTALAADDFTVRVLVEGLEPGTVYFYRWRHGSAVSDVGTFRTAPAHVAADVRFAWSGDSDGSRIGPFPAFNTFEALDAARRDGLDFFLYLGDVIYSDERARGLLPPAQTLDEFRALYRENRTYPALRNLLRETSVYAVWDDHEVRDNWDGQAVDPFFYEIGSRAFLEYMPLRTDLLPDDPVCAGPPQFRVFHWGTEVDLIVLDTRSCRSPSVEDVCGNDLAPTLQR